MQMMSAFDDTGKRNVLRDRVAARVGYDQVNRYIQPIGAENRPLPDEKVAELENNSMSLSQVVTVKPNENHLIHARVHGQLLGQMIQQIDQGQMTLEQAVQPLVNLVQHQTQHIQSIQADKTVEQEVAALRQQLQQAGEFTYNGMEKLKKQQQEQQISALANPPQQAGQQVDPLLQQKMAEHQLKLQMMQEQFTLQQQMKLQESRQKLAIEDAKAARKIASDNNLSM
jgi:hypothetical protein